MDDILTLTIPDYHEFSLSSYNEMCYTMDKLEAIHESLYFNEAVIGNVNAVGPQTPTPSRRAALINNQSLSKSSIQAYDAVTDAGGLVLKTWWNVKTTIWQFILKALTFIAKGISKIPIFINNVINKIEKLPETIRSLARGDIQLYITVSDISLLYNKLLINNILTYISNMEKLIQGATWKNIWQRANISPTRAVDNKSLVDLLRFAPVDTSCMKKMTECYNKINQIGFNKTTIRMDSDENKNIYFGDLKVVRIKGKELSYFEALKELYADLGKHQNELKVVQQSFSIKVDELESQNKIKNMKNEDQKALMNVFSQSSKVVSLIGNLTRYIYTDLTTVNKSVEVMMNKANENPVEKPGDATGTTNTSTSGSTTTNP